MFTVTAHDKAILSVFKLLDLGNVNVIPNGNN